MTSIAYNHVLKLTGYVLPSGKHAAGLYVANGDNPPRLRTAFSQGNVDAVFTAQRQPLLMFKDAAVGQEPSETDLQNWRETAWNIGLTPLLWIVTPTEVRIFDCYDAPFERDQINQPLRAFKLASGDDLTQLQIEFGRVTTESGAFWSSPAAKKIDRRNRVDHALLDDLAALEQGLVGENPGADTKSSFYNREFVQRLIGRCIFLAYLQDRGILDRIAPKELKIPLVDALSKKTTTERLFRWLRSTFNGDLFPIEDPTREHRLLTNAHLSWLKRFVSGETLAGPHRGQLRLFKYKFDCIPSDLISSIYEQFARAADPEEAHKHGLHYTPVELVHFVLDPVLDGLSPKAKVIDPACGSGAFLVETFRRLVWLNARNGRTGRTVIRRILREQIYGIDNNQAALRVAAFGLYLAALEVDDGFEKKPALKFEPLIGTNLFCIDSTDRIAVRKIGLPGRFDAVVGNPPWTFVSGQRKKTARDKAKIRAPKRSADAEFLDLAIELTKGQGRIGLVMEATPFFSLDDQALTWRNSVISQIRPLALINLSLLRRDGLFPSAKAAALVLIGRSPRIGKKETLLVGTVPWSPDYARSGQFAIGPDTLRSIPRPVISKSPSLLKAAAFGGSRELALAVRLIESYRQIDHLFSAREEISKFSFKLGFKIEGSGKEERPTPAWFRLRPYVDADSFRPLALDSSVLSKFHEQTIRWPREEKIYRAPLVLIARAFSVSSALQGRLQIACVNEHMLYNSSFVGISFSAAPLACDHLPLTLASLLVSAVTSFQLVAMAGTVGLERPLVEPNVLRSLRVPNVFNIHPNCAKELRDAFWALSSNPNSHAAIQKLDNIVFDLYELDSDERTIVRDSVEKAAFLIDDARATRQRRVGVASVHEMKAYATEVVRTVNSWLSANADRHLEGSISPRDGQQSTTPGLEAVKFQIVSGPALKPAQDYVSVNPNLTDVAELVASLGSEVPPYINERRSVRVYKGEALYLVKPANRPEWTPTKGLEDGDRILADHPIVGEEDVRIG